MFINEKGSIIINTVIGTLLFSVYIEQDFFEDNLFFKSDKHNHSFFEVHFIESGCGIFTTYNEKVEVTPGKLVLIAPRVYHSFKASSKDPVKRIYFRFTYKVEKYVDHMFPQTEVANIINTLNSARLILIKDNFSALSLLHQIRKELSSNSFIHYTIVQNVFSTILIDIVRNANQNASQSINQNASQNANQSANQNVNQSANQSTSQNASQNANQSASQNASQNINRNSIQNVCQNTNQNVNRSVNHQSAVEDNPLKMKVQDRHKFLKDRFLLTEAFFDDYKSNRNISDLANILNLSTRQTSRFLKKYYNCTFKQKLIGMRIEVARELLCDTNYSIDKVMEMIGFTTRKQFIVAFKESTGMPPSVYRKKLLKQSMILPQ